MLFFMDQWQMLHNKDYEITSQMYTIFNCPYRKSSNPQYYGSKILEFNIWSFLNMVVILGGVLNGINWNIAWFIVFNDVAA